MFNDRSQRQRREEAQRADDNDHTDQPGNKKGCVRRERPGAGRYLFLSYQRAGDRQDGDCQSEPSDEHGHPQGEVIEQVVGAQPGKGAAIVVARR